MTTPHAPKQRGHGFGTAPVFLAAISTILGAILFLRFGYAVGQVGVLGALAIILIAHAITIPTGLAVAEIATNLKVEGGGEYYIISRSFGRTVGAAIGISLYLSQAVSVGFYMLAFSEAFRPLFPLVEQHLGFTPDARMVGIPAALLLMVMMLTKGANIGVRALWVVVSILAVSLALFFLGSPTQSGIVLNLTARVPEPDPFFKVFAIVFPAFTGMTAGVGLSGDLKNPRRSIPLGTVAGTLVGMVFYIGIVFKMGLSATPAELGSDQFIMSRIALWGPIIFIGLGAATVSSAIGSLLVAPRTLQALAHDGVFPMQRINRLMASGRGETNEPFVATLVTSALALLFVSLGSVDVVAQLISIFFLVTYGALCAISFLQHFAGNPSYRPTFRSKWYLSLLGAVGCAVMMWQMQPLYAVLAALVMVGLYFWMRHAMKSERDLSEMLQGVSFQLTRKLQVMLQRRRVTPSMTGWRPSFIAISSNSLTRLAPFDLLRWISHHYGFGTFIHFIKGPLTEELDDQANKSREALIRQVETSRAELYVDTIISPSFSTAVAQVVQIPGISGLDNNSVLFEFRKGQDKDFADLVIGSDLATVAKFNICILRSSDRHFGYKRTIHIWLRPGDYRNASLMILLGYILIGHPQWKGAEVRVFAAFPESELAHGVARLNKLMSQGRIPISVKNVSWVLIPVGKSFDEMVNQYSAGADLVIAGLSQRKMRADGGQFLTQFDSIEDILFVRAGQQILVTASDESEVAPDADQEGEYGQVEVVPSPA